MGMGNYPCSADIVERDFVKEICPNEYDAFIALLKEADICFDEFCASASQYESEFDTVDDDMAKKLIAGWIELVEKFNGVTGLGLDVVYHNMSL